MSLDLTIQNRQRTRTIGKRQLRKILTTLLDELLQIKTAELGITLVAAPEMQDAQDFRVVDVQLPRFRVQEWQGLVFVALAVDAF